ncbi:PREDICTED: lipase 3-like [Ceratosolen solmsi marchali]|uniref:Lipase n=1 Tax=Ceratosolen solmsi marchali TaxID=326594 RepID=A0AAJ7DW26_9HYME|nr:PREDICTED: lipase 3-like [Ceratosolen solmsi marchali]
MAKVTLLMTFCLGAFVVTLTLATDNLQDFNNLNISSFNLPNHTIIKQLLDVHGNNLYIDDSIVEFVSHYGYRIESHTIETNDGYILQLHRITGNKTNPNPKGKPAVLLQHGLLSSSIDWVITGPERALGLILADVGYDVWLGNVRGNVYSRKHRFLSVNNPDFWNFSWHEIGIHDIPAMIDYILHTTGQKKISYVGHSQGTTVFFVMTSELPAYNEKIHAMFSLAPIVYSSNMFSPILQSLSQKVNQLKYIAGLIGFYELKPSNKFFQNFKSLLCKETAVVQPMCKNLLFMIAGFDSKQLDKAKLPLILRHVPAGASVKQIIHYGQIIKTGTFRKYDYGSIGNLKRYGKVFPPSYDLKNVRVPVALHYSSNDWLANIKDVNKLYSKLPNKIGKFYVKYKKFNHIDYLFAKDVKHLLYDKILTLMSVYES